mmetsp:Transcript_5706/g.20783  ORF Transcript_5706/g.20783 Transcript_5706/m.20783 type:complete len:159 (-) Transcript_5706:1096-1572(-)
MVAQSKEWFEDYHVGEERKCTISRTITEADIVNFAGVTGDFNEIHLNKDFAAKTQFGQRIAHGLLTLSAGVALGLRDAAQLSLPKSFVAFYGMDQVRFTNPVFIGDTISLTQKVVKLTPKSKRLGVVGILCTITKQDGSVVLSMQTNLAVQRRPHASL